MVQGGSVDVSSVDDGLDDHCMAGVIDAVHDAVVTATGSVQSLQLPPQGSPDPSWVLRQSAVDELDDGCADVVRRRWSDLSAGLAHSMA